MASPSSHNHPTIVSDDGFEKNPKVFEFSSDFSNDAWDVPGETVLADIKANLNTAKAIRICFGGYADGRGFTLAAQLRRAGFTGHLRASGPLVADQYAMARRSGFDDVEVEANIAERQPEEQWLARADWRSNFYQSRLRTAK